MVEYCPHYSVSESYYSSVREYTIRLTCTVRYFLLFRKVEVKPGMDYFKPQPSNKESTSAPTQLFLKNFI